MTAESESTWVGYSVFDTSEECYEYNENACYIAANQQAAKRFLNTSFFPHDCEIHSVSWDDLLKDYGCSCGRSAMEAEAFSRFKALALQHGVRFEVERFDGDVLLMVVEIDHQFLRRLEDD
ncbi:MAG: hypothetical protein NTX48_16020 [Planctomycetales bacterium]|nr:hypothetical protein [Planctomycetales bacterium]